MNSNITIAHKLGCETHAIDNCILVKASVEAVSNIFKQYFELEVRSNCKLADYINMHNASWKEIERQREVSKSKPKKSFPPILWAVPIWRYCGHQWTIIPLSGREESIAFALSLLLNTQTIIFHDSSHASVKEFKIFYHDRLIEHYLFGFECGEIIPDRWDIKIEDCDFDPPWSNHQHFFKSSSRQVAELEIRSAVLAKKHDKYDRGFLDSCLKYYKAYIPLLEETPYDYRYWDESNSDSQQWNALVEQMDIIVMPSDWSYFDRNVPTHVT
jgi:hypothetical protein